MAAKGARGRCLPIGVDLGTSGVKLAQFRTFEGNLELTAAGMAEIPTVVRGDPAKRIEAQGRALRDVLRSNPFKGKECVLSIPADSTVVEHVRAPKGSADDLNSAIREDLRGKLPFPWESAVVRHIVAGDVYFDDESKQEIIAVAASRATVDSYLAIARKAKLDVICVNVEPCAIVECFSRLFKRASDSERVILYVDIGALSMQVVLSHGTRIVFARNLKTAGNALSSALAKGMGVPVDEAEAIRKRIGSGMDTDVDPDMVMSHLADPLDAMSDELQKCLRYYESVFRSQSIERAVFLGGQAYDTRLCQEIARRVGIPAQVGDPLVRVRRGAGAGQAVGLDGDQPRPDWAVAIGLSLGAATDAASPRPVASR